MTPRILLYGIGGVYNYGCEAIVRGTERLLREIWPDVTVRYASVRSEEDRERLKGSQVQVVPRRRWGRNSWRGIGRRLAKKLGFDWRPFTEVPEFLRDTNVVLSIGGDLYTSADAVHYDRQLIEFGNLALRRGKVFVVWAASVGPFEGNGKLKLVFLNHLKRAHLITCREPRSTRYLNSMGLVDNVVPCADPAFVAAGSSLVPAGSSRMGRLRIGINLSPLSVWVTGGALALNEYVATQARAIEAVVRELGAEVVLVPHVVCNHRESDDDLRYLRKVYAALQSPAAARVQLISGDIGFLATRAELAQCDAFLGARMHSVINALAAGVPSIFIAYSDKAYGMAEYIHGHTDWVIPLKGFLPGPTVARLSSLLSNQLEVKKRLKERLSDIASDARRGALALRRIVSGGQ